MEMHQIRYFLAVARLLNFTRAAEECNVAQPSLTRAIHLLEAELGGELFHRERNLTHLSELGSRMRPLIQQCYDSASSAKSLAISMKSGSLAPLKLALSRTINIEVLLPQLTELSRSFKGLELKFLRGTGPDVADALKKGDADLCIAGPLGEGWERLDSWPLFSEPFVLAVNETHRFGNMKSVPMRELGGERLVLRAHCESAARIDALLGEHGIATSSRHEATSEADVVGLLAANIGVAVVPASMPLPATLRRLPLDDLDHVRVVSAYGVAGRQRSPVASTLLKMLRAADWAAQTRPAAAH
jgi:DNA-binding transcriptional LysR family regulator